MGSIQEKKTKSDEKRFVAMIRHSDLKSYGRSFLRLGDAKAWMMQEEVKIQQGLHIEGSTRKAKTLNEAIQKFIADGPYHPY